MSALSRAVAVFAAIDRQAARCRLRRTSSVCRLFSSKLCRLRSSSGFCDELEEGREGRRGLLIDAVKRRENCEGCQHAGEDSELCVRCDQHHKKRIRACELRVSLSLVVVADADDAMKRKAAPSATPPSGDEENRLLSRLRATASSLMDAQTASSADVQTLLSEGSAVLMEMKSRACDVRALWLSSSSPTPTP